VLIKLFVPNRNGANCVMMCIIYFLITVSVLIWWTGHGAWTEETNQNDLVGKTLWKWQLWDWNGYLKIIILRKEFLVMWFELAQVQVQWTWEHAVSWLHTVTCCVWILFLCSCVLLSLIFWFPVGYFTLVLQYGVGRYEE
jgi:hypothetical protein